MHPVWVEAFYENVSNLFVKRPLHDGATEKKPQYYEVGGYGGIPKIAGTITALKDIPIGEIRAAPDEQLKTLEDLSRHWLDIVEAERKRRVAPQAKGPTP